MQAHNSWKNWNAKYEFTIGLENTEWEYKICGNVPGYDQIKDHFANAITYKC